MVPPPTPKNTIEAALDSVKAATKNAVLNDAELYEVLKPYFALDELSKRSLGSNWSLFSKDQQREFTVLFSQLILKVYSSKIKKLNKYKVEIVKELVSSEGDKGIVYTKIKLEEDTVEILYKLLQNTDTSGTWKVYDVVINNIGLVATYRNEFASIIRKEGINSLLIKLREKVNS